MTSKVFKMIWPVWPPDCACINVTPNTCPESVVVFTGDALPTPGAAASQDGRRNDTHQCSNALNLDSIITTRDKIVAGLLASLAGLSAGYGQQLAFPGALGYGEYATGGRGGSVYHVTNLADSGAGSFRDAVSQPNRIIVFDVGGYIALASAVSCANNLTIAGQTAPGGGIGVMNNEVSFSGKNNIICRYMRFRQGGSSTGSSAINLGSSGSNMIFDHISAEFGQWDTIDAVGTDNFTVQNSIIADPIKQQFGAHVEGANATWIGNLWANAHDRQPLAKANTVFVNNVIYNYVCAYTTGNTTGAAYNHDLIDNYFIAGPSTTAPTGDFFQVNGGKAQNLYYTGNLLDSAKNGLLGGNPTTPSPDFGGSTGNTLAAPWSPVTPTIPTTSATAAYRIAISAVGALPRDPLDTQVIGQVNSLGSAGAILTSPSGTGLANSGFGAIAGGTPPVETDGDGIPDYWKAAVGLNLYTNQAMAIAANGYANIENYANWLAAPHAVTPVNTAVTVDLWQYSAGFTNVSPVYTVNNVNNGAVVLSSGHLAQFTPAQNFSGLGGFNPSRFPIRFPAPGRPLTSGRSGWRAARLTPTDCSPWPVPGRIYGAPPMRSTMSINPPAAIAASRPRC